MTRLAAVAVLIAMPTSWAQCAGWQGTAEARMECCAQEQQCPMHKSDTHAARAGRAVTQAQADTCCAGSDRNDTATTGTAFLTAGMVALAPAIESQVVTPMAPALEEWRALVPLRASPVPKHLLLSVLLV